MTGKHIQKKQDIQSLPYRLSLCNGSKWRIRGYGNIRPWVDKLASVMELDPCNEPGNELLFCFRDDPANAQKKNIKSKFIGNGWWDISVQNVRYCFHDEIPDVLCEVDHHPHNEIKYGLMPNLIRPIVCHQSIDSGGLPLHTALIERNGKGFLLAGSGRTGKSTCCSRIPKPWNPLCDDETLLLPDKKNTFKVHPFPTWSEYTRKRSEKTWNVQHSVPISAIFVLKQSEADAVEPVGKGQAAIFVNQSAIQSSGFFWREMDKVRQRKVRDRVFKNACDLVKTVPVFRLHASLHGRFWEEMEKVIDEL